MLEVLSRGELFTREITLEADHDLTVLYASDLHLTPWSHRVVEQLLTAARNARPDVILLGGDLIDLPQALPLLKTTRQQLQAIAPTHAIPGNHDPLVGLDRVGDAVGGWLETTLVNQTRIDAAIGRGTILCTHYPSIFKAAVARGYRLVLAGHLHGSQFILKRHKGLFYPGAWFYQYNGDEFHEQNTTMLVSRGVNDTLPLRWNCPREVLLCRLQKKS